MAEEDTAYTDELVERCQRGDRTAFDELVLREQRRVYQLAFRIIQSQEDLDDVVQDIFFLVYRKIKTFRFESRFSTWLTRISLHECLKVRKRRKLLSWLFGPEPGWDRVSDGVGIDSGLQILQQEEQHQALRGAINRLSEQQRVVILLRYFEELSCEEIAETLSLFLPDPRLRVSGRGPGRSRGALRGRPHGLRDRFSQAGGDAFPGCSGSKSDVHPRGPAVCRGSGIYPRVSVK